MICVARASWRDWPDPDWILDRYLGIVLDGLRTTGPVKLERVPPTSAAFDADLRRREGASLHTKEQAGQQSPFRRGRRRWPQ